MKRPVCILLAALLLLCAAAAPAGAEGFTEEEIDLEDILEIKEDLLWTFPVALEDLNPEYIILANKHYLLDKNYVPADLVKVPKDPKNGGIKWAGSSSDGKLTGWYLREECAQALCDMNAAIRAEGGYRDLYLKSAYRSYGKQNTMYKNRLAKNKGKDDGWVSMAGASDHQTGLGCDVVPSNWKDRGMNDRMMKEPECQWMAEHCHEFGFVIRYPADKKDITEINTEPWHLRYVGIPAAAYMKENNLCLEAFTEQLQEAIRDYLARGGDPDRVEAFIQKSTDE